MLCLKIFDTLSFILGIILIVSVLFGGILFNNSASAHHSSRWDWICFESGDSGEPSREWKCGEGYCDNHVPASVNDGCKDPGCEDDTTLDGCWTDNITRYGPNPDEDNCNPGMPPTSYRNSASFAQFHLIGVTGGGAALDTLICQIPPEDECSIKTSPSHSKLKNAQWLRWSHPALNRALEPANARMQYIDPNGGPIKYDEYSVVIERMPSGLTPEEFLLEMATDMNKAINNKIFDGVNVFEKITPGFPRVGTIYDIHIGGDEGSVILVDITPTSFTFQTISRGPSSTGTHPENGARQFGFVRNDDGSTTFYTRGVSQAEYTALDPIGKPIQAKGWTASMEGIANQMKNFGGNVDPKIYISNKCTEEASSISSSRPLQDEDIIGGGSQPLSESGIQEEGDSGLDAPVNDDPAEVKEEEDEEEQDRLEEMEEDTDECPEGTTLVGGVDCVPTD